MASITDIYNRALQKLGAKRVVSPTQDSPSARACNSCYDSLRQSELRSNHWNFAIKRAQLAADGISPPIGGRQNNFQLPSDFLRLLEPYPELLLNDLDWQIEGQKISTNDTGPLQIRYIWDVQDANFMDSMFREALASKMALEMCEELTQSNTKKDALSKDYAQTISEARRINAFENVSGVPPEDTYLTVRD